MTIEAPAKTTKPSDATHIDYVGWYLKIVGGNLKWWTDNQWKTSGRGVDFIKRCKKLTSKVVRNI